MKKKPHFLTTEEAQEIRLAEMTQEILKYRKLYEEELRLERIMRFVYVALGIAIGAVALGGRF